MAGGTQQYSCDVCFKTFQLKSSLVRHQRLHTETEFFSCHICERKFGCVQHRDKHVRTHYVTTQEFSCDKCPRTYKTKESLARHKKYIHENPDIFACHLCDHKFTGQYELDRHIKAHQNPKFQNAVKCDVCSFRFKNEENLAKHKRFMHKDEDTFDKASHNLRGQHESGSRLKAHSSETNHYIKLEQHQGKKYNPLGYNIGSAPDSDENSISISPQSESSTPARKFKPIKTEGFTNSPKMYSCSICSKTFQLKSSLVRHQRLHSESEFFSCHVCQRKFSCIQHRDKHVRTHIITTKEFSCDECQKTYKHREDLARHKKYIHEHPEIFACPECDHKFTRQYDLDRHLKSHADERSRLWVCKVCGKRHASKSDVEAHVKYHHIDNFSCDLCDRTYKNMHGLVRHKKYIHENPDAFQCTICDHSFTGQYELDRHIKTHNEETRAAIPRPWACTVCGKCFLSQWSLETHINSHTKEKQYACSLCDKKLSTKGGLVRHKKTVHSDKAKEAKHQCPQCYRLFTERHSLTRHLQLHSDNPAPWQCTVCQKSFSQKQALTEHMQIHSGTRFKCSHVGCDKSFSTERQLKRHFQFSHVLLNNKQYECHICLKKFSRKIIRDTHVKRHDDSCKIFACHLCPKRFLDRRDLNRHVDTHERIKYECRICKKLYSRQDKLATHLSKEHNIKVMVKRSDLNLTPTGLKNESRSPKSVKCRICRMSFPDKVELLDHTSLHKSDQVFVCFSCDKSFSRKESLHIHRKSHPECQIVSQGDDSSDVIENESHVAGNAGHVTGSADHMTGSASHVILDSGHVTESMGHVTGNESQVAGSSDKVTGNEIYSIKSDASIVSEQPEVEIAVTLFPCTQCELMFLQEEHLLKHQVEHTETETQIAVDSLAIKQESVEVMKNELLEFDHEENVEVVLICEKCRRQFPSEGELKSHVILCNICD